MFRDPICVLMLTCLVGLSLNSARGDAPDPAGPSQAGLKATPEEMQWWLDAKFGMFIHWGPVSQVGKELSWSRSGPRPYDGKGGDCIPQELYDSFYKTFNPVNYNADQWVKIARDAGMQYMVLTTKHHDGFSEFHTKLSDYNIANTPFKRDIVKEYADACHKNKMRLGFYYSQRDWHHPDYMNERQAKYLEYMNGQIKELLGGDYGKVDVMWFDSISKDQESWQTPELIRMIRQMQPGILINNRVGSVMGDYKKTPVEWQADFDTPEMTIGDYQLDRAWESCITLVGHQWSYKPNGEMMSLKECIQTLARCVGGGGNLLLNVGPMATGEIEARQIERLREIGAWLKVNGEAVYGTRGGPIAPQAWGVSTHKGNAIYLHVLDIPADKKIRIPQTGVKAVKALSGGAAEFTTDAGGTTISLDKVTVDPSDTVVRVETEKAI